MLAEELNKHGRKTLKLQSMTDTSGESMARKRSWMPNSQGTTIGALTNLIKVAKQQNRCNKFKKIQSFTRQPTMATTLARTWTLKSYLTLCRLQLHPNSLALTTPSQPHQTKSAPFSQLLSHQQWKGSARRRSLPPLPPMIISSILISLLMIHQGMSIYHQHLNQSTRVWTLMLCMILLSLMMSLNPSLIKLDEITIHVFVLVWYGLIFFFFF